MSIATMEDEMSKWLTLAAAVLLMLAVEDCARADLLGPDSAPSFDAKEVQIIERNAALRSLRQTNPWAVRHALDALAKTTANASNPPSPNERNPDPDLDNLIRTSPEALNDLFQVFKAAAKRTGQARDGAAEFTAPSARAGQAK
jgi:hypothetical protein